MTKNAILLVGPTGSGKTPFGTYLEEHGLNGKRIAHFDFGELLRQTASGKWDCGMSEIDMSFLNKVLQSGALLENETFYLAEKIITYFNDTTSADYVLLNGLPRHVQQAKTVAPWFNIRLIIHLDCSAETVYSRIYHNYGGDRSERSDDSLELIAQKLKIFNERTRPLLEYYSNKNVPVVNLPVSENSQPGSLYPLLRDVAF